MDRSMESYSYRNSLVGWVDWFMKKSNFVTLVARNIANWKVEDSHWHGHTRNSTVIAAVRQEAELIARLYTGCTKEKTASQRIELSPMLKLCRDWKRNSRK